MPATTAEEVAPGRLSRSAREAASSTALELLGTYFADAPTWVLQHQRQVAQGDVELEELASAIRIRVALSAARRLDELLHQISTRLSFRYARVADETIGGVRGRLDVPSYIRTRARRDVPRRYPVRVLQRRHETPENVLAMYAAGWVTHELRNLRSDILPPRSPERIELLERHASLTRTLTHPVFAQAAEAANAVWRQGRLNPLVDQVEARIDGGHLAWPDPYKQLVEWIRAFDPSAATGGTLIEWGIYDERFDPKLFEIWILHQIGKALERRLGSPAEYRPLWERGSAATYAWKLGGSSLRLHFQLALSGLSQPRWKWADGKALEGVPDVTAHVATARSGEAATLIDAKLRQRDIQPTEELYKLLGYFHNRDLTSKPYGAIVYYAPEGLVIKELLAEDGGKALSLGVDPSRYEEDSPAFDALASLLVDLLDRMDPDARLFGDGADQTDEAVTRVQERVVADLLARAQSLPPGSLDPYRHLMESQLPTVWPVLDDEIQTILVTAEYFGASAPGGADLSGPLLGLCSVCERLLCGPGALFDRMAQAHPSHVRSPVTLGAAMLLKRARKPRDETDHVVRSFIDCDPGIDSNGILQLAGKLLALNEHRRAAAHTEVILRERWQTGHGLVLGRGDIEESGLLPRLVAALSPVRSS